MPAPLTYERPWGAAIQYWLKLRGLLQADIVRNTGLTSNTVSRAVRGLHVNTQTLEIIADRGFHPLRLTVEDVLIAPDRRQTDAHRKQTIVEAVELALRHQPVMPESIAAAIQHDLRVFAQAEKRRQDATRPKRSRSSLKKSPGKK